MRAAIICIDTRGGIQPYLAVGVGLKKAGHDVVVIAPKNYKEFVESVGLECFGIDGDIQSLVKEPENADAIGGGLLASHLLMLSVVRSFLLPWMKECLVACKGADLILGGFGGMLMGEAIGEKLGIRFVQAHVQPITSTSEFPGLVTFEWLRNFKGWVNRLSHFLTCQVFWQPLRKSVNIARREVLDLPPARFWGNVGICPNPGDVVLYGYSPSLLPRPGDWPPGAHVTGYWTLDRSESWTPPPELVQFLEAGPKPIAIGFGSMSSGDADSTTHLVLDAAKKAGQRVVLLSGWGGMKSEDLPDFACLLETAPHAWLFPRCSLAVHHGGAGTTGAALRAGIPSIIIPFAADQPFWAWLLASKGLGTSPCIRKRLTSQKLAQAIESTLANPDMLERASELGKQIRQEDGVANAVAILESLPKLNARHK